MSKNPRSQSVVGHIALFSILAVLVSLGIAAGGANASKSSLSNSISGLFYGSADSFANVEADPSVVVDTVILGWDTSGLAGNEVSFSSTTTDANLNSSMLTRGTGLNAATNADSFNSTGFSTTATTLADAIVANDYLQFSVSPMSGFSTSLSALDANFRRSSTGPNTFQWQYSLDGFATAGTNVGSSFSYTGTSTSGAAQTQIDLSSISALQNVTNPSVITFRLFGWGATGSTGSFGIGEISGNDLAITGSTQSDAPLPTTTVVSLNRQMVNPTSISSVMWQVVFADPVSDLTGSNFALVTGGTITGASISSVGPTSGPPSTSWNISVNTGTGTGTLGLNMVNDAGLTHDVTNLPFTGEVYDIDRTPPLAPVITSSDPASPNSDTTPEIHGTAEPLSAVRLFASTECGGDPAVEGVANSSGIFIFTVTVPANTATTFTALSIDAAGNVSACSNQFTYTNVTTAPSGDSVVNSTADTDDGSCDPLGSGTGNQDCTLREAILIANSTSGHNTISFNIPGAPGVVRTITPATQLPAITEAVTINGYSQPGSSVNTSPTGTNAVLLIEVTGAGSQNGPTAGFVILSGDSTIRGIVINRFSDGIRLNEGGNNVIAGNRIGTNATGTAAAPNNNGINIINGSNGNRIGGTAPADRNLISGNGYFNGVGLTSPSATSAPDHAFGGNGIAFNVGSGPIFNAKSAAIAEGDANLIQGNLIGTNAAGSGAIPNNDGIFIAGYTSSGIQIGGVGGRNVISGNLRYGIALEDTFFLIPFLDEVLPASVDVIRSNYIGTAADGTTPLGNQNAGISISECSNCGITFTNKADAVAVTGSTLIGGVEPGEGNVIAYNGGSGVQITKNAIVLSLSDPLAPSAAQASATGNRISGNSIHSNSQLLQIEATGKFAKLAPSALGLGIDLGNDGVTPNDPMDADSGPNNLQNFPVITGATGGNPGTVTGTLNTTPNTSGYQIEFFANESCDPSGYGEGQTFLGYITTGASDGSGDLEFTFSTSPIAAGQWITATATDPAGNTSEFSACFEATAPPTEADLFVIKSAPEQITAGTSFGYTIFAGNLSSGDPAVSTVLTDVLPPGTTFTSITFPDGWSCDTPVVGTNGTVSCSIASLPPAQHSHAFTLFVTVPANVAAGTVITNTASITSDTSESNPENNSASASTTITTSADLWVTITDTPDPVLAGENITYTVTATNSGPSDAVNVGLTMALPTGTTLVSASSSSGWSCQTTANFALSCLNASMAAGSNSVFTVVVHVDPNTANGTQISASAAIATEDTSDPNPGNNTASTTTTVLRPSVSINGNVRQSNAPFASTPLQGVLITLTGTGVVSGTTRTTDAAGNYSFDDLDAGGTYTVTPSMTGKTFDPISRTYPNLNSDITNANFIAFDSQLRNVRVVNGYAMPGDEATVPIVLTAQGNEAMLMFRLTYDEALLDVIDVNCGAASGVGCSVQFTAVNGVLDVTVTPASGTYAPGQKEIVTITFDTVLTDHSQTPLIFSSEGNLTTDSGGNPLATSYTNGFVVFGQGKECDVAERFTGDGLFRSDDGDVMRQMVAGLPLNWAYNEFQRADCAPFETKGDGQLDATDFQLMALTVAVLVPQQTAGGPFGPLPAPPPFAEAVSETRREMRVVSTSAGAGDRVTVSVELDAQGDETAASFTLAFDPMKLRNPQISLANGSPAGSHLTANTEKAAEGRVMMLIDSMGSLSRSTTQMVSITFDVAPSAASGETELYFTSDPTGSAISDKQARSLQTRFTGGTMTIRGSNPEGVEVSGRVFTPEGAGLRNARVVLTDEAGISRSVITNSFGYYSLEGVAPQRSYRIAVVSKRYRFTHRMVEPASNLAGVDLIAHE